MGYTIELTCGNCSKCVIIPDGEPGMTYACPHCGTKNRAAREAALSAHARQSGLPTPGFWDGTFLGITRRNGLICFGIGMAIFASVNYFMDLGGGSTVSPRQLNTVAFGLIADAHGEDFRSSAARTESALANVEDLVRRTSGADRDPRIRELARTQAEYERAMARAVATEREAYEHPERVSLDLWRLQLAYHQTASRLAAKYRPDWVSGLNMRIEHDKKMIRRLGG